ncbi:hypothetical protein A2V71_02030 [Candidatus Berkelbacteria bacterium RBG_13_40_8]|uniref:OBG-type G domain-containing protein n=1 Tax=Candidatus Berkelbacteria bacterium RBG_13_40_8 TaxID=1797467 RepID=A0A1F5DPT2_9BACT|nr:MAG: hypothetical protein A2V71_02030 [Candidatus Berkelbacteria bacterium RBG_13_40_8]
MSLKIGIVGLPNVGKSTLFNALVRGHQAKVADYPFTTIEPNVGIVEVPDERLAKLGVNLKLQKVIPATIEFIDIAGLVKNAHKGEGLGNQFLSHIRECDAIVHVLDGFSNKSNPDEDKETINIELELAGIKKPTLYVMNIKEDNLDKQVNRASQDTIYISAKMEEELIDLPENEQKEFLKSYNLSESGLNRLIKESYKLLGLITFYTLKDPSTSSGRGRVQAWPILKDTTAPQAAAKVHTDMEKGFIAADVCHYIDLIDSGGWHETRENGKLRTEGKDYQISDGDIVHFKFQV